MARYLIVVGALVATACASTAKDDPTRSAKRKATTTSVVDAGAMTTTAPAPAAAGSKASGPARRRGATAAGSAGSAAGRGTAPGARTGEPTDLGPVGPGVTDTEIKIGFWYLNSDATCSAVGATSGCESDNQAEYEAIVKYINANGGIAGRKVNARIYSTNTATSTYSAQAQTACTKFTEDDKVFAVVSEGQLGRPDMPYCLARKEVPFVDPGYWPLDRVDYEALAGFIYQPTIVRPERWVTSYIDGLADQGFFAPGTKVGLIRYDGPGFTRVTNSVLKPRLSARGVRLADEAIIKTPPSAAAYGEMSSELSSVVLRFRTAGIDRVLFFEPLGEMSFFYFPQAEAQSYRPRYGISSMEWGKFMATSVPAAQLRGAIGIGWSPHHDINHGDDPGGAPGSVACKRALSSAGIEPEAGRNPKCDMVFFLKAALDRAPALNAAGMKLAVEGLGTSFESASSFATRFGPGRYDGPSAMRHLAFNDSCTCFRYSGGPRPLAE